MIQFYGDVSGKNEHPIRVAAGYLVGPKTYPKFSREWQAALVAAEVEQFHATDFFTFHGEFEKWTPAKQAKYAKRFTAIAEKQTVAGFASGIETKVFNASLAPEIKGVLRNPQQSFTSLMICVMQVLRDVSNAVMPRGFMVAAILEGEPGLGQCIEYFNFIKKRRVPWTRAFSVVGTGDKSMLGIQAADLLAYESRRHLEEVVVKDYDLKKVASRKPFTRLLKNQRVQCNLLRGVDMLEHLPEVKAYMAQGLLL